MLLRTAMLVGCRPGDPDTCSLTFSQKKLGWRSVWKRQVERLRTRKHHVSNRTLDCCKKRESKGLILVCRNTQHTFKAHVRKIYMSYLDAKKKVIEVTYYDMRLSWWNLPVPACNPVFGRGMISRSIQREGFTRLHSTFNSVLRLVDMASVSWNTLEMFNNDYVSRNLHVSRGDCAPSVDLQHSPLSTYLPGQIVQRRRTGQTSPFVPAMTSLRTQTMGKGRSSMSSEVEQYRRLPQSERLQIPPTVSTWTG